MLLFPVCVWSNASIYSCLVFQRRLRSFVATVAVTARGSLLNYTGVANPRTLAAHQLIKVSVTIHVVWRGIIDFEKNYLFTRINIPYFVHHSHEHPFHLTDSMPTRFSDESPLAENSPSRTPHRRHFSPINKKVAGSSVTRWTGEKRGLWYSQVMDTFLSVPGHFTDSPLISP